ncbi:hypothetical protein U91I_01931 [alpha proteobacterium U9-1i]|nr:hypothetical protein U91I_01931 [alpha proteobacterium U9-1i]
MTKHARTGEQGLSVLEALIVTAITAMLIVLLLPLAPRGMRRDYAVAETAIATGAAMRAERAFHAVLSGFALPPGPREPGQVEAVIRGNRIGLAGQFLAIQESPCARAGVEGAARVFVRRDGAGGALVCEGPHGAADLLRWAEGRASFSYSADAVNWTQTWPVGRAQGAPDAQSVLVRFTLASRATGDSEWIGRAGATEPVDLGAAPAESPANAPASAP